MNWILHAGFADQHADPGGSPKHCTRHAIGAGCALSFVTPAESHQPQSKTPLLSARQWNLDASASTYRMNDIRRSC